MDKRNRGKHHLLPLVHYGGIHMAGKSVPKVKQKLDKKRSCAFFSVPSSGNFNNCYFLSSTLFFDTVGLSFRKWNGMFGAVKQWVGLENYQKIFSDNLFWNAMLNSVYFMIGGFVILMPLSFGLAMLVTAKIKGNRILQNLLLPSEYVRNNSSSPDVDIYVKSELWYL